MTIVMLNSAGMCSSLYCICVPRQYGIIDARNEEPNNNITMNNKLDIILDGEILYGCDTVDFLNKL